MNLNVVYNEDCLVGMKKLPNESIDLILCDLPYGTTACAWDTIIPFDPLWAEYERLIKENGAIVLTSSQPFTTQLIHSNISLFKYCWVWDKVSVSNPQLAKIQPLKHHEDVCVFGVGRVNYYPQGLQKLHIGDKKKETKPRSDTEKLGHIQRRTDYVQTETNYPKSIIKFPRPADMNHPTEKPVELFEYLIKTYTKEGEIVLDNCMGSGTTAEACLNTGRKFIGYELDKDYYAHIQKRIETTQNKIRKNGIKKALEISLFD